MNIHQKKPGYVLLLTVLIVGAVVGAVSINILQASVSASQTSLTYSQGVFALAGADACAEHAINQLRLSGSYNGNETLTFGNYECEIEPIVVTGPDHRIRVTGRSQNAVQKIEVHATRDLFVQVVSWELTDF